MNLKKIAKSLINIKLNRFLDWTEVPIENILQKAPESATPDDIAKLSMDDLLLLFHSANAPKLSEIQGEYDGIYIKRGWFGAMGKYVIHNVFGPGRWMGKAFRSDGKDHGHGYNIFSLRGEKTARARRMKLTTCMSNIDNKDSLLIDYSCYNKMHIMVRFMCDELRQINPELYIGMGYMGKVFGPLIPAPFIIYNKPRLWVGCEK